MILVDTSVWSLAFRRSQFGSSEPGEARVLRELIRGGQEILVPGTVLQEILSGLKEGSQFERLREILADFPIILATEQTHVEAAQIANACQSKGVAVSTVDCLIAAMAIEWNARIFTTDRDFFSMADHCPLSLYENL